MFKLVILSALIAVSAAGYLGHAPAVYSTPIIHKSIVSVSEPVLTKIGEHVKSVPSAVSHQRQTIVHSKPVVTPVLAHSVKTYSVPVVNTYTAPIVKTYAAPLPILRAPLIKAYSAPLLNTYNARIELPAAHVL